MKKYRFLIAFFYCLITFVKVSFSQVDNKDIGDFKSLKVADSVVKITTENAEIRISAYSPTIIRVNIAAPNTPLADTSYVVKNTKTIAFKSARELTKSVVLATDSLTISVSKFPVRINFYRKGGQFLNGDHVQYGVSWINGKVYNYRLMGKTEHILGMGGKTGNLDKAGSVFTMWNTNVAGHDQMSFPFYMGVYNRHAYGLYVDNTSQTTFDFGASNLRKFLSIEAQNGVLNYYFFGAHNVSQIVSDYGKLTGKATIPPLWAFGYQSGLPGVKTEDEIRQWLQQRKKSTLPMDVFWLHNYNEHNYQAFSWNKELMQQPMFLVDSLKAQGMHILRSVRPELTQKSPDLYNESISKKYVATYPLGDVFYTQNSQNEQTVLPDFFRKEVRSWWSDCFKNYTIIGTEGFINTYNEPTVSGEHIPDRIRFGNRSYINLKNVYATQMLKANAEGWYRIYPNKRSYLLSRAGFAGMQAYAGAWIEPREATDQEMLLSQRMTASLGLSGMPMVGVNIASKESISSPELLLRWHSLAVYAPLMTYFPYALNPYQSQMNEGSVFDDILKKDVQLRYRLLPYVYSQWHENTSEALPLVKSLAIDYSWDENVFIPEYQNQFLFGNQFLVCPTSSASTKSSVYLPKGDWYRFSTDSLYRGNASYTVNAPLSDVPVFVKSGAIVPMQNVVTNTLDKGDGILQLHVWKGEGKSVYHYYEDDGLSFDFKKGVYYQREISFDFSKNQLVLEKVEGSFESKYQQIELILHGFNLPAPATNPLPTDNSVKINHTGMASFTTYKMIHHTNERIELTL